LSLPRLAHLRAAAQFQTVFREGRRLQGASFRLHVRLQAGPDRAAALAGAASPGPGEPAAGALLPSVSAPANAAEARAAAADALRAARAPARLGITVSKRVDKRAVGRNRIRRQIRECFRLQRATLPPGDYVVLALSEAARQDNAALREELLSLFERARTLKPRVAAVTMPPADASDRPLPTDS
jgi:ribonuclease P protein component